MTLKLLYVIGCKVQLISKCPFGVFKSQKKTHETYSKISALAPKKVKIEKVYGYWYKVSLFFLFDLILEARAEILEKISLVFGRSFDTKRTF